jgi:16S rRNA (guanine(527)-N(7))-methyltransferase RsmG
MPKHTLTKVPASAGFRAVLAAECPWVSLSQGQVDRLEADFELLKRWNAKLNLTATLDIKKHFGESLFLGSQMKNSLQPGSTIADIGSGGGFPGVPLAILYPDCQVTLVESDRRKSIFLRECAGLSPNLRVLTERAEDLEGRFDWVVSRAVTPEFVAEVALKHANRIGMILREAPVVAGISNESVRDLPWPGTGVVWIGKCST